MTAHEDVELLQGSQVAENRTPELSGSGCDGACEQQMLDLLELLRRNRQMALRGSENADVQGIKCGIANDRDKQVGSVGRGFCLLHPADECVVLILQDRRRDNL